MELNQLILLLLFGIETVVAQNWVCLQHAMYEYNPVCGTDGFTYDNECQYQSAKMDDEDLHIIYDGPCRDYDYYPIVDGFGNSGYSDSPLLQSLKSVDGIRHRKMKLPKTQVHSTPLYSKDPRQNTAEKDSGLRRTSQYEDLVQQRPLHGKVEQQLSSAERLTLKAKASH